MKPGKFLASETLEKAYLGKRALDLVSTLMDQVHVVYRRRGIVIPVSASSTLQYIAEHNGVSHADIARALEVTHQITTQRVEKLQKIGLVEKRPDLNDRRRFEWHLTEQGREQANRLKICMDDAAHVYEGIYEEINVDLSSALEDARNAMLSMPLTDRFAKLENIKEVG